MVLSDKPAKYGRWILNALLTVLFVLELLAPGNSPGLGAGLIVLAAITSLLSLAKRLPLQNVLLAATLTALVGGIAFSLTAQPAIALPFGPLVFEAGAGVKIFNVLPWPLPLLCIVVIFAARGVTQHILQPWRKTKNYGWWVMALTALLVTTFDLAFQPFAVQNADLWRWQPAKMPALWEDVPPLDSFGWFFITLLTLAMITPSLIRKQPEKNPPEPMDYHPVAVWLGALVLFAMGAVRAGAMTAVWLDAGLAAVTLTLVVRGAKWPCPPRKPSVG